MIIFFYKGDKLKAKEFYSKILATENTTQATYDKAKSQIQVILSE